MATWQHSKSLVINFLNFFIWKVYEITQYCRIFSFPAWVWARYLINETSGSSWKLQLIVSGKSRGIVLRHREYENKINRNSATFTLVLQCSVLTLTRRTPMFLSCTTWSVICMSINSRVAAGEIRYLYTD